MRGGIASIIIFVLGLLLAFAAYFSYVRNIEVAVKAKEKPFSDVLSVQEVEQSYRVPLDMERKRALEESIYYVGSFGGFFNTSVHNITNPYRGLLPEPIVFYWKVYSNVTIPSDKNLSKSLLAFLHGYFNYYTLRDTHPEQYIRVLSLTHPIKPEWLTMEEEVSIGNETVVRYYGMPLILRASVGTSYGNVFFYPVITARSKVSLKALRDKGKEVFNELPDALKNAFNKMLLTDISVPTIYVSGLRIPIYDFKNALIAYYLGERPMCSSNVIKINGNQITLPINISTCTEKDGKLGVFVYNTTSRKIVFAEVVAGCDLNECNKLFNEALKKAYLRALILTSKNLSSNKIGVKILPLPDSKYELKVRVVAEGD